VKEFINKMINYDKENIPHDVIKKVKLKLQNPEFKVELIRQKVSYAADIAAFCIAMNTFYDVNLKVKPK